MNAYEKTRMALVVADVLLSTVKAFGDDVNADVVKRTKADIKDALKITCRNCDVGSAEEQHKRFMHFCTHVNKSVCIDCPLIGNTSLCQLQWAQLPYEKGVDK